MSQQLTLRDQIPESCKELLSLSDRELKSEIPALARDKERMQDIEKVVSQLPSRHQLYENDSTDLSMVDDESVELVVTSPPYFNIKDYNIENGGGSEGQIGDIDDYEQFHSMLNAVWEECYRALRPGGRLCVVVGDILLSRSQHGRHRVIPLHATIQEHAREIGFDNLAPIIWQKIGNASLEAGSNSRFLGKPYEPGAVIKNDIEYILLFRKPGGYRSPSVEKRILSTIEADMHQTMFRQVWSDIDGEQRDDHPAPYPVELAERLIRMFSFVGDTVLDPFAGAGGTMVAASKIGRDSVNSELESEYVDIAADRIKSPDLSNYDSLSIETYR